MKTPPPKTIVCGTDFSENAQGAASAAAALARISGKSLALFHVADQAESADSHADARRKLLEESVRLADTGLSVNGELLQGPSAGQSILDHVVERPDVDLIVVSPVSKTAVERWTLGSVSESLAESVAVPTLVVRQPDVLVDWAAGNRLLKVLVAADFSESSREALRWAAGLRKLGPCQMTVAYVNWPPAERERLGVRGPMDLITNSAQVQQSLERDLREMVKEAMGEEEVAVIVQPGWGRLDAHLVNLATDAGADLLVVGTHQRVGLERWRKGSVSRGILRHAPMSVACVPAKARVAPVIRPCRRVLAALDLEKDDTLALPTAYSIVHDGGEVCLLNVQTPPRPPNPLIGGMPESFSPKRDNSQDRPQALNRLKSLVPEGSDGIRAEFQVRESDDVAAAICEAAEAYDAEIVCVGAHNRPGMMARVLGSVALDVLKKCRRPVLVVWPKD